MDTKILRSKILDLAIRGKLVPQDAADGSALDLLAQIGKERGCTIKPLTEDVPFEIPENWCWVKLGDVFDHTTGKTLNKRTNQGTILRKYITTCNVYWEGIDLSNVKETLFTEKEIEKYTVRRNDLLVCEGGDIGRSSIWESDEEVSFQNHLHRLRPYITIDIKFYFFMFYYYKQAQIIQGKGIGMLGFSSGVIDKLSIPLPPLAEQKRIVAKVEELLAEVEKIEQAQKDISDSATILQSKVLDLAIRGKLVPQDAADGSALDLLAQIGKERGCTIKPLTEDVPFDIPENWCWVKFGEYMDVRDGTHDSPKYYDTGYPFVTSKNLVDGRIDFTTCKLICQEDYDLFNKRSCVEDGDILYAMIGSIGNPVIVKKDRDFAIKNVALFKKNFSDTNIKYVYLWLLYREKHFREDATGGLQPFISLKMFRTCPFPLPPLAEQKRIVAKVEELLEDINKLK